MTTAVNSPAMAIRRAQFRSSVHMSDLPGTNTAARKAASRAAQNGELIPVRRGLYFKAPPRAMGWSSPESKKSFARSSERQTLVSAQPGTPQRRHWALRPECQPRTRPPRSERSIPSEVRRCMCGKPGARRTQRTRDRHSRGSAIAGALRQRWDDPPSTYSPRAGADRSRTAEAYRSSRRRRIDAVRDNHARLVRALDSQAGKPSRAKSAA